MVLGGRQVGVRRPRVRTSGQEVPLPTCQAMSQTDPLQRRTMEQLLLGVSTRGYARSLDPLPDGVASRGVSQSAVSRRFVAKTAARLAAWQAPPLDGLDLVSLVLDGVHIREHCVVVALGISADGTRHALGRWEGSTENAALCQRLLANLQSRGLRTDRSLFVILDGSKALRKAVTAVFGEVALVQRCPVHQLRNILEHLPERQRPWVQAIVRRAYHRADVTTSTRLLRDLARRLEPEHPGAATSVSEGLEESRDDPVVRSFRAAATVPRDDERGRAPHQPDPPRDAPRHALARRADDGAVGRGRYPRCRQRLPAPESSCGHADVGRRATRA